MIAQHPNRWQDAQWWLALLAGPAFYLLLIATGFAYNGPTWITAQPILFAVLALAYPILEEIVFRGMLQDGLSRRLMPSALGPISKANFITSLIFAGLHVFSHTPLWAAAVFLPSLVFGYFRERHAGLVSPIILHAFYNGGYYALFGAPL